MAFPDTIERRLELHRPVEQVWAALTTAEGLGTWFGERAEVDLRVGGEIRLAWESSGDTATLVVERVEPPHLLVWTWGISGLPDDDPRRTTVTFALEPTATGTTLTVVEQGFAQVDDADLHGPAFEGNERGWTQELGELVAYLDAAA